MAKDLAVFEPGLSIRDRSIVNHGRCYSLIFSPT